MPRTISKICILIILCTFFLSEAHARKKSLGSTFSYAGIGLSYEHKIDDASFMDIQLRMETSSMFSGSSSFPGATASFTWNMIFAQTTSREGNKVIFFAGPGAIAGFAGDLKSRGGFIVGLKGRVGGECTFSRNVSVSLSISPVIGVHTGRTGSMVSMLMYKTGLLYGIMPEVGIKYAF